MTPELEAMVTASPEDLYGPKGRDFRDFSKADRLIMVANDIDEARSLAASKNLMLTGLFGSYAVHRHASQTLVETELSFFVDPIDEHVWVVDYELEKFQELFGVKFRSEGTII